MSSPSKRREMDLMKLMMSDYKVEMINDGIFHQQSQLQQAFILQMDNEEDIKAVRKRMKPSAVETMKGDEAVEEAVEEEEPEKNVAVAGSEEMELSIARLLERIERFTQMVSELLEAGKTLFKELSNEFEERMIMIHKEQIEKWQEEINELRLIDASNEEANALLHNARFLLHQRVPM